MRTSALQPSARPSGTWKISDFVGVVGLAHVVAVMMMARMMELEGILMKLYLCFSLCVLVFLVPSLSEEVLTCAGNVRSESPLDYTQIEVGGGSQTSTSFRDQ